MDMAEKVMQDLMNDRDVSPNERTFCALIRGYSFVYHKSRAWRAERMYFWLCKMRDSHVQPNMHTAKPFFKLGLHFPSVDGPFWKITACRTTLTETRNIFFNYKIYIRIQSHKQNNSLLLCNLHPEKHQRQRKKNKTKDKGHDPPINSLAHLDTIITIPIFLTA